MDFRLFPFMVNSYFFMAATKLDVKDLAGKWNVVLHHSSVSQEQYTAEISRDGIFKIVSPHLGEPMPLSESTNDEFPAKTGWYENTDDGSMFVRLREDGRMEMHYFDKVRKDFCTRTYKGLSNYCTIAIGNRESKFYHYLHNIGINTVKE